MIHTAMPRHIRTTFHALLLLLLASVITLGELPEKTPVQVFILAGQSNMEGVGKIDGDPKRNAGKGSLSNMADNSASRDRYRHLRDNHGNWTQRDDVMIWHLGRKGKLAPGFGARKSTIGPELGFGHAVGDASSSPVLLIKTAWGGKSLAKDFRPPSSGGETGPFYIEMLKRVNNVIKEADNYFPEFKGRGFKISRFAWHQGWNDGCSVPMTLEYEIIWRT
jgi:hypothetical protein